MKAAMTPELDTKSLWKATPTLALMSALIALVAGVVIAISSQSAHLQEKTREMTVQSRILASTVSAALSFNDRLAARDYVKALGANPEILLAGVYDTHGALFAGFSRSAAPPPSVAPNGPAVMTENDDLVVMTPVVESGTRLGSVYVRATLDSNAQRLGRFGPIGLLAVMVALIVGVLGVAGVTMNAANDELRSQSLKLSDSNSRLVRQIEEREKAEAALRQAQKMEAIGQLTGGVAHDFNNLLQIMMSCMDAMRRRLNRLELPTETALDIMRYVNGAMSGGERAAALTRQLLAFARRMPLEPTRLDVNKLVSGMSELLRRTLGESISIETVLAGGLWATFADGNQLESALVNMAVNARDAMPQGGKLTIETANAALDDTYASAYEDLVPGQYVLIAVTDTGAGIPADILSRVFEPFFTTKDVGHGTGLGLSQVYGFVKQSGGHIKIYSEPGEGTTVKIYLPRLMSSQADTGGPALEQPLPLSVRAETILVVEDEDAVRAFSVEMLRELGYNVLEAADAHAALRVLEAQAGIDLLFTDVGLPGGVNGRALADEALKRWPELKVLFTSGYTRNAIVHGGKLDPGVALLGKPFTYAALAQKVSLMFGGS
jgi:signal transduction histidine kinase